MFSRSFVVGVQKCDITNVEHLRQTLSRVPRCRRPSIGLAHQMEPDVSGHGVPSDIVGRRGARRVIHDDNKQDRILQRLIGD